MAVTDLFFSLVASQGIAIIFSVTILASLAVPVPGSFVVLAGGAFVNSGDLTGWQVVGAAFAGAALGDQIGYEIGRLGGVPLLTRLGQTPARAELFNRSRSLIERWGGSAVFMTRWGLSPLGPHVNPLAGALGMGRLRFVVFALIGEALWVAIYVALGYMFASNIAGLAELTGNLIGSVTAGTITLLLGVVLWRRLA